VWTSRLRYYNPQSWINGDQSAAATDGEIVSRFIRSYPSLLWKAFTPHRQNATSYTSAIIDQILFRMSLLQSLCWLFGTLQGKGPSNGRMDSSLFREPMSTQHPLRSQRESVCDKQHYTSASISLCFREAADTLHLLRLWLSPRLQKERAPISTSNYLPPYKSSVIEQGAEIASR
jgi:hypothetical protein